MVNLPFSNIARRKGRSAISILAIGIGIALLLILVGVTEGTINELTQRIKNVGADMIVQPKDASFFLGLKSSLVPRRAMYRMRRIEGVEVVSPVVTWATRYRGKIFVVYGVDTESFEGIGGKFTILEGENLKGPYDLVVDKRFADTFEVKPGDELKFLRKKFTIAGVSKSGIGTRIYMPLKTLQKKLDQGDKVSMFFVKCNSAADSRKVAKTIEKVLPDLKANIAEELSDVVGRSLSGLKEFIAAMCVIALMISSLVVLLAMYTTILERTREIGILKALGATQVYIAGAVVTESTVLSIFGVLAGYGLAFGIREGMGVIFPLLTVDLKPFWLWVAMGIGVSVGILGAILPAFMAARQDPVKALRYE